MSGQSVLTKSWKRASSACSKEETGGILFRVILSLRSLATVEARLGCNLAIFTLPKTFDEQYWSRVA